MRIEAIAIKNYRVFRDVDLRNLPRMTVVVGANGTGKSTLFDVFSFLKDALSENAAFAVARRGGFGELASRESHGPIEIAIKFRESGGSLVTYELAVGREGKRVVVEREVLRYRRGKNGKPWRFVDFTKGKGQAITNETAYGTGEEAQRADYALDDPSILAIKGLGQFQSFRIVSEFRAMIEKWHISDFHVADARPSVDAGYAEHLSPRGDNVALVAQYLYEHHRERYDEALRAMSRSVPGISGVQPVPAEDGRLLLRFKDGSFEEPFIARYVSDGTVKMFAYLMLLHDPDPHQFLAIEEPENQLYPHLLWELAEDFRAYAKRGGQVFVSTHSTEFLNGVELDEVFCLVKENGFSKVLRPKNSATLRELADGERPGRLWRQGLFESVLQ